MDTHEKRTGALSNEDRVISLLAMLPEIVDITCREAYEIINSGKVRQALFANWNELKRRAGRGEQV